jgi:glycosyltransferase involved in cell wall biosynthesis
MFDVVVAKNESSYIILKEILPNNSIELLEFDNYYMEKSLEIRNNRLSEPIETIEIATFGYLDKNIDKTFEVFKKLESNIVNFNYKLNIYIDDIDKVGIELENTKRISIHKKKYNYSEMISILKKNDIIIDLSEHEGGIIEALNNNKLVVTLNTYPNNEYIYHKVNGYLVDYEYNKVSEENEAIIKRGFVNVEDYYNLMCKILDNSYRVKLNKIICGDKNIINNYE